ncbi:hypothetical protein PROFUN_12263 [Planoprotostelium fungivorum]|uniref:Uncharacterized protein n=1 Tax=Planoprotostelium fungivorum TaxID=1890364 RepID=A0A2P6N839_9EUKA|nr:hypothetical protein PROFUN_12263 [Planoprotostelium fungivorum]
MLLYLLSLCLASSALGVINLRADPYYNATLANLHPERAVILTSSTAGMSLNAGLICALDGNISRMAEILDAISSVQLNRSGDSYGRYSDVFTSPWTFSSNTNTFISMYTSMCIRKCGAALKRMSPSTYQSILTSARMSTQYLVRRQAGGSAVTINYTNMYLGTMHVYTMWGDILGNDTLVSMGHDMLKAWIDQTNNYGVSEYNAQSYLGLDLGLLQDMARNGPQIIRKDAAIALDLFPGAGLTGGPTARSYRYTRLRSATSVWYSAFQFPAWNISGLSTILRGSGLDLYSVDLFNQPDISPWGPSEASGQYLQWPTKSYRGKFTLSSRTQLGSDRSNYVSPGVSIGAAGYYNAADISLVGLFTSFSLPPLYLVTDILGDPYCSGASSINGHCTHPSGVRINVQKAGTILAGVSWDNSTLRDNTTASTNIIVPLGVDEILINGKTPSLTMNTSVDLPLNTVVSVRHNNGSIVFRVLQATTGVTNDRSPVTLRWIVEPGGQNIVGRVAIFHRLQPSAQWVPEQTIALVAFEAKTISSAQDVLDMVANVKTATYTSNLSEGSWTASAVLDGRTLAFSRKVAYVGQRLTIVNLSRTIDGKDDIYPGFSCEQETERVSTTSSGATKVATTQVATTKVSSTEVNVTVVTPTVKVSEAMRFTHHSLLQWIVLLFFVCLA